MEKERKLGAGPLSVFHYSTTPTLQHSGYSVSKEETMEKIHIFDTTLRDGEQIPGACLNPREKLEIAMQLARLGVDAIEAGFPISSPGDFEAVTTIAKRVKGPTIVALARAVHKDIETAWDAIRQAEKPRIHVFLPSSDIHIQKKFGTDRAKQLEKGLEALKYAKSLCPEIEYSPEDASRTDPEYLVNVVEQVIAAGATVVNILIMIVILIFRPAGLMAGREVPLPGFLRPRLAGAT